MYDVLMDDSICPAVSAVSASRPESFAAMVWPSAMFLKLDGSRQTAVQHFSAKAKAAWPFGEAQLALSW